MLILIVIFIVCSVLVITGYNIFLAFTKDYKKLDCKKVKIFEVSSFIYGAILQYIAVCVFFDMSNKYNMEITNIDNYAPISPDYIPTIICIVFMSFAGFLVLRLCDFNKISPILIVFCISAMFLFVLVSLIWMIQTIPQLKTGDYVIFSIFLFPFNFYILIITTLKRIIFNWNSDIREKEGLKKLEKMLLNSKKLPLLGFIFMIPLLFVIIIVLTLFGQEPDSIVKAWTDTAEWTFSQHIPPPRLDHDGHYLCTVAAKGHKKLVKPIRVGNRLGEKIVVNRQLCIANAFEEIIQEKTPGIHKIIRNFYNKYGYPVSKYITKTYMSDIMYIAMKPLEWCFLFIIYAVDAKPENRINRQYTDFTK